MNQVSSAIRKVVTRAVNSSSKLIQIETNNLAKFSDGSCVCTLGDTSVLVTAISKANSKPPSSFTLLTVEFKQKAAAAGRIPTTHLRRETGFSEKEVLSSRMIDRSVRSSFPKGFSNDTQITCNLLAVDGMNNPDVLAINGASASLAVSDIPWAGPIGAVRIGLIEQNYVANPTRKEMEKSALDLVIAANGSGNIMMMDGSCRKPLSSTDLVKAIRFGVRECKSVVESIVKLQKSAGKAKKPLDTSFYPSKEHIDLASSLIKGKLKTLFSSYDLDKISRGVAMSEIENSCVEAMSKSLGTVDTAIFHSVFTEVVKSTYEEMLSVRRIRCDGRKFDSVRPLNCSVDLYKPLHGSALFQRGQTQVVCSLTFDSPDTAYQSDMLSQLLSGIKEKNFMLHYEFPPYATNEIGRPSSMPGRREVGHGALAENAIRPLIPPNQDMTIRLNCEVLESSGSSSMASVSAGSLSLMDAGVQIEEHVAGVAMGLFFDDPDHTGKADKKYMMLTDILGLEDFLGEMDFKIAGTSSAVTALQLDVKRKEGLTPSIIFEALQKAQVARSKIIKEMNTAISGPRKEPKENHPVMKNIHIPPNKRAKFLGFGGCNVKKLVADIGVKVLSNEHNSIDKGIVDDASSLPQGNFTLFAPNKEAMQEAEEFIEGILDKEREPEFEFNGIYTATIVEMRPSGVMIILYPDMHPTFLSTAQLDIRYVNHPSALGLDVGDQIQVKYFGRDPSSGQMRLSRKSLMMTDVATIHKPQTP